MNYEKIKSTLNMISANTLVISVSFLCQPDLVRSAMNSAIHNNELLASLCYMSNKSINKVKEICKQLPYDLADIQAYYRMYGEFPK